VIELAEDEDAIFFSGREWNRRIGKTRSYEEKETGRRKKNLERK
jgi:hypothetical protein